MLLNEKIPEPALEPSVVAQAALEAIPIYTGETYFDGVDRSAARRILNTRPLVAKCPTMKALLRAQINHGRWLVECPNCISAEMAFEDRLFFCSECKNKAVDGYAYKVVFPTVRREIETILKKRPTVNRNWKYGETVGDLETENTQLSGVK